MKVDVTNIVDVMVIIIVDVIVVVKGVVVDVDVDVPVKEWRCVHPLKVGYVLFCKRLHSI